MCVCVFSEEGSYPRKRHWLKSFHSCNSFPSNVSCSDILSFPVVPSSLLRAQACVQGSTIRQECLELVASTLLRNLIKKTTSNLRFRTAHSIKSSATCNLHVTAPQLTRARTHPGPALQASGPVFLTGFRFGELYR